MEPSGMALNAVKRNNAISDLSSVLSTNMNAYLSVTYAVPMPNGTEPPVAVCKDSTLLAKVV